MSTLSTQVSLHWLQIYHTKCPITTLMATKKKPQTITSTDYLLLRAQREGVICEKHTSDCRIFELPDLASIINQRLLNLVNMKDDSV